MQTTTHPLAFAIKAQRNGSHINPSLRTGSNKSFFMRLLDRIAEWDANYRSAQKLREMPGHRLDDMGIDAADIENILRRR